MIQVAPPHMSTARAAGAAVRGWGMHLRRVATRRWSFACVLACVTSVLVNLTDAQDAHHAEAERPQTGPAPGACVSSLLLLPSSPDPNTDVLFNMQTRKMEEAVYIAAASGRTLVEPRYIFGARNWTWFEEDNHNQLSKNEDIDEGMLGTIEEPLSSFFELPPLEHVLQRPISKLSSYIADCGGNLDLVLRFYGHSGIKTCDGSRRRVAAWGIEWTARQVVCVHAQQLKSLDDLLAMAGDAPRLALEFLPPKFVEQREHGWRWSPARMRVREALVWAAPLVREAEAFIASNLALAPDDAAARVAPPDAKDAVPHQGSGEAALAGGRGGGVGQLGDFVAVHWRRGDRAFQEEMGIHGHVDVALTSPTRMVQHVQEVVSRLQDVGDEAGDEAGEHLAGVTGIFLATNCGSAEHLQYVEENLGPWRLPVCAACLPTALSSAGPVSILHHRALAAGQVLPRWQRAVVQCVCAAARLRRACLRGRLMLGGCLAG